MLPGFGPSAQARAFLADPANRDEREFDPGALLTWRDEVRAEAALTEIARFVRSAVCGER